MVEIQKLIKEIEDLNYNDEHFAKTCADIANGIKQSTTDFNFYVIMWFTDISSGKMKIHDFVTNLEQLLVHISPTKRATGTLILSTVISKLSKDFLADSELQFISGFYADRLKDNHQVNNSTTNYN